MELARVAQESGKKVILRLALSTVSPDRQYVAPEKPLIFTHIPRTAGTTLDRIFRTIAAAKGVNCWRATGTIYDQFLGSEKGDAFESVLSEGERLTEVRYLFGHIPFGVHEKLGLTDASYAVVLRNPKQRVLSQLRLGYKENAQITSEDVANVIRGGKMADNCQVRMVAGCFDVNEPCDDEMLARAVANLKTSYKYVGFQDSLGDFIHDIIEGEESPSLLFIDRNLSRSANIKISPEDRSLLQDFIRYDIALYAEAVKIFGKRTHGHTITLDDYLQNQSKETLTDVVYGVMPDTLMGKETGVIKAHAFPEVYAQLAKESAVFKQV